ncbi:UNVERIFIED_CONTAM: Calcium permeable stress-gated cation channel 1 [Sesamum calycinum]|uniref:Calcium permeable stress-gated cation channel 1 n=1 Tax=Sesamum calycinum TaxID=2727403 RepID=A0AAW2MB80_9LAMI
MHSGSFVSKFVNLDWRSYVRFLNWVPDALRMPESELIDHAGLDSAVYLRIYLLGLKIFIPIALLSWAILVPVNWTNNTLAKSEATDKLQFSDIDKLSISNVPYGSLRFWTHIVMAYAFTFWTCYTLRKEYATIAAMRLHFLASERSRPDQFTVLVRNVPPDSDESVSESVEHFFLVNHPDHYLTYQVVINANKLAKLVKEKKNWFSWPLGEKVDAIDYQIAEIERLSKEITEERERLKSDPKYIMPAAFVSFRSRWGAAVCAQTQQTRNPTLWLTEWAPEPRDVYWDNLAIPYVSLTIRRLIAAVAFFFLTFFFMIPVTIVQSLANIEGIERRAPFLKPIIEISFIKSVIQGFLPGIALKIFLIVLPTILMMMSKFEGFLSISALERRAALRYYTFNFVNVFLVSVIAGTAFQQLDSFLHQSANDFPPFILVFFALAYVVFRHQIINVYNQEYESAAAFWPDVHGRIISALVFSQLILMGLMSTKGAAQSTPFLIALPVLTIWFHRFCKGRYEPAFIRYPLQEAMMKDTLERAREPNLNLKSYLRYAYIHPVFKNDEDGRDDDQ